MKKIFKYGLGIVLTSFMLTGCSGKATDVEKEAGADNDNNTVVENKIDIKIASLKGPTTMGMVKLMSDSEKGETLNNYKVEMSGTADEIVPKLVKGEIDIAAVPCNLASVLYNKTEGKVKVAAINTLGVLYVVENGNTIKSIEDLKGKTIYSTGKGTTPEYVLNYVLAENGLKVDENVKVEYKSEATEIAAILAEEENAIAMLPQPFVTTAQSKNEKLRVALDMTEEWDKVQGDKGSTLVTGVIVVRNEFLESNKEAFNNFLKEYKASTEYVTSNLKEGAELIGKYEIVPAQVAEKAVPFCNITYIDGNEMKDKVSGYLNVLFKQNPKAVGGKLPEEDFYLVK